MKGVTKVLELKQSKDMVCDVCGNEAVSKLADSRDKKIGLALCSQCLDKLDESFSK